MISHIKYTTVVTLAYNHHGPYVKNYLTHFRSLMASTYLSMTIINVNIK